MDRTSLGVVLALWACSDPDSSPGGNPNGGSSGSGNGGGAAAGSGGNVAGGGSGGSTGGTAGSVNGGAGSAGALSGPVELPPGSRELDGVVNLVDADAAQELEQFLVAPEPQAAYLSHRLSKSLNVFLEHYVEEYDFVFLVTDHVIENVPVAGAFEAVNRPAVPGGGFEIEIASPEYRSTGRVKGVIGIPYQENYYPPFTHEVAHYWGVYLDSSFGFGLTLDRDHGSHWGAASVNGQLGGYDASTLECETPAGAAPPGCTALPSGRTRYTVDSFAPYANGGNQPFAPLELYLMGLFPAAEVPESIQMLTEASLDYESFDEATNRLAVEASGITTLAFADIIARHGEMALLPELERKFDAAFVVISASPAPDQVMADVATWAGVWGGRQTIPGWNSFETNAGGLATVDTELGPRRDVSMPAAPPRVRFECDVLAQDCGRPDLACHSFAGSYCALSGGLAADQPCNTAFACAPGLQCVSNAAAPDAYYCKAYCSLDAASPLACETLCPGNYYTVSDDGVQLGGGCIP